MALKARSFVSHASFHVCFYLKGENLCMDVARFFVDVRAAERDCEGS